MIHTFLGDKEKTFLALEAAFEQRDLWLVWLGVEPVFDNLRSDARFQRLLAGIGIGPVAELTYTRHTRTQIITTAEVETDSDVD